MTSEPLQEPLQASLKPMPMNPSIWQTKPWWCQPWSIVLTGIAIPVASWLLLHLVWITLPVVGVMVVWWVLFLGLVPAQYAREVREFEQAGGKLSEGNHV